MVNPMALQGQNIYQEQCKIIRELSDKSDCVIIGRCADFILREKKPFRIFVYAEMQSKINRCRLKGHEETQLTDSELKRHIMDVDKRRAQYYEFYTDQKWGERENYDLCINTTNSNIPEFAGILSRLFKS